jgi:hypothetical protein
MWRPLKVQDLIIYARAIVGNYSYFLEGRYVPGGCQAVSGSRALSTTGKSEARGASATAYFTARISSAMNVYCFALMALMAGSVAAMRCTSRHSS